MGKLKRDAIAARYRGEIEAAVPEEDPHERISEAKTLSWSVADGTIELVLDRAPCNEIGSETLAELEQFVAALRIAASDRACSDYFERPQGRILRGSRSARTVPRVAKAADAERAAAACAIFWSAFTRVMNAIDAAPLTTIAAVHGFALAADSSWRWRAT